MSNNRQLPENAFRELKDGEEYKPLMPSESQYREVTPWSLTWGIIMAVVFSAATAYLGLKVGQVFEAAIPITIIAVGVAGATHRKDPLGENVIIQSIGACSGMIVAGAIFTLPALYILQAKYPEMTINFLEIFIASVLGGVLGILFLIPFRKYFVKDMHGKYPFPEATASTQVLISGEGGGGSSAKPLLVAGIIGGLYDFFASGNIGVMVDMVSSRVLGAGEVLAQKAKLVFQVNTGAALLGMGYIVGLKYAAIICAGSILTWWIIVPGIALIWPEVNVSLDASKTFLASAADPQEIYNYAKSLGIGAIAMAGVIGIAKSWSVIKSSFGLIRKVFKGSNNNEASLPRTQQDLSMKIIAIGTLMTLIISFVFFLLGVMNGNLLFAIVGILIVAVIAFLFTTVAANAIAIVGSNPVSGMTLMTLILACVIMAAVGLKGVSGMTAALIMGGVVCTALSTAGSFITDLKIGYWLGSTPKKQETFKFIGVLVSAATVGGVIMILNKAYGFSDPNTMSAPQARAMAAVIEPIMNGGQAPWLLYGIGAAITLLVNFCGISSLAFALGMFIPLQLNLPLLVGGLINWYVSSRSKDEAVNKARADKGTLLASGFIAGGALMGVVSAGLQFGGYTFADKAWLASPWSTLTACVLYFLLIIYLIKASLSD
ncbi:OPT family oligopeptide transporter [Alloprevotella rava F0323]|uniref:OPT family oligopeptide transporter n=1 Tax=Alloprevotella rava F0323 TaxID=679199 RepID=G5G9G0_9BACT|nr:oligopeptide transporter, OPT family [Alloprevotella rava]EHG24374.1 OPT family oligopeptide transporter [Alloprevotella rava F0323]